MRGESPDWDESGVHAKKNGVKRKINVVFSILKNYISHFFKKTTDHAY